MPPQIGTVYMKMLPQSRQQFLLADDPGLDSGRSFSRRSNCTLAATMMVERLIATAPTLMGRSIPQGTRRPPATGMAIRIIACGPNEILNHLSVGSRR